MKFELKYTLVQLLEVYGKTAEVPKVLANEGVGVYGLEFYEAIKKKEAWIDPAIEAYLGSPEFIQDLKELEEFWETRLECNNYWLQLECDRNRRIRLGVDMEMKDF